MNSVRNNVLILLSFLLVTCKTGNEPVQVGAQFTASEPSIAEGEQVVFIDNSLGNPTSWNWTFEGGSPATSTTKNPTISYATEGSYSVSLTVSNGETTNTLSKPAFITVLSNSFRANFSTNETVITAGSEILFTDKSNGNPLNWEWTFESGIPAQSTEQNPKVSYVTSGKFAVTLKVWNTETEHQTTKTDYITVNPMTTPPYSGTIFINPDIITENDPTSFISVEATGSGERVVYDRRAENWVTINAHLFNVTYTGNKIVEAQVNPEFTATEALEITRKYSVVIGRIPFVLLNDVDAFWIHKGNNPFGGGNRSILIHTEQGTQYEIDGILEETLVHEASHTSLDGTHAESSAWKVAQNTDATSISDYAKVNPTREDIAESFLTYLMVRYKENRLSIEDRNKILAAIPNRLLYFDNQQFDVSPLVKDE